MRSMTVRLSPPSRLTTHAVCLAKTGLGTPARSTITAAANMARPLDPMATPPLQRGGVEPASSRDLLGADGSVSFEYTYTFGSSGYVNACWTKYGTSSCWKVKTFFGLGEPRDGDLIGRVTDTR